MENTIVIQNIITPYRARLFNILSDKGLDFIVYYMSQSESDRNWNIDSIKMNHNNWLDKHGLYCSIKDFHIHFNPCLIFKVLRNKKARNVILGVSYVDFNIVFLAIAKKLHITQKTFFFWAEANYLTNGARTESIIKSTFRKFVFSCVDGALIVPGKMSEITFKKWKVGIDKFIHLPNTICDDDLEYKPFARSSNRKPTFLMPIRLVESVKGMINFFEAIGRENIEKCIFYVAGDGKDRELYNRYVTENKYEKYIKLVGFCDAQKMENLYNISNAFVLPSFSDPSPLSMVEALKSHLPILCSSHCGNHFEVVTDGENGLYFNPLDKDNIKETFVAFLAMKDKWPVMGEFSYRNYVNTYDTNTVAYNFINNFRKLAR